MNISGRIGYHLISRIPWIVTKADREVQKIIEEALFLIEFGAAARSRVDTGQMQRGWQSEVTGYHEGTVYNMVEHTYYNEYGTVNMTAQPMLAPAIEEIEPYMLEEIKKVYEL